MRAIDDCHQHNSKLAPTLRSVTRFSFPCGCEVSLTNLVHSVFSRHEYALRYLDAFFVRHVLPTENRFFRDECFGFVHFVEPTSDVPVALGAFDGPFGVVVSSFWAKSDFIVVS